MSVSTSELQNIEYSAHCNSTSTETQKTNKTEETKTSKEFEQLKEEITKTHKLFGEDDTRFPHYGMYLRATFYSRIAETTTSFPDWLKEKKNFLELLTLLADRQATEDFIKLFKAARGKLGCPAEKVLSHMYHSPTIGLHPDHALDILSFLQDQSNQFFEKCGKLLLMAALECPDNQIIVFLVKEKGISPNFDIGKQRSSTPLNSLFHKFSDFRFNGTPEDREEMLNFLCENGADVNQPDAWGIKPLDAAVHLLQARDLHELEFDQRTLRPSFVSLLKRGASPFTFSISDSLNTQPNCFGMADHPIQKHPLIEALQSKAMFMVEQLLVYGAGLIRKDIRTNYNALKNESGEGIPVGYVHCDPGFLSSQEIVFKHCSKNKWILTVRELSEMLMSTLNTGDPLPPAEAQRIAIITNSVLAADPLILQPGVLEAFRKPYLRFNGL